ncbi:SapC family protein [Halovibrio sp. HP20-50]|uniref:SapC family protein n=1 Tax=Halovibrio sp. HP20-59 TaxID=3080275 RepID=UPI00294B7B05|nr:SapC family protein [Halovibrio sp. HP20-59]MEA2120094.1 SapC family protein [Halovibrio sp. HP20-59]
MFRTPQVLKAQAHANLTLTPSEKYHFASGELFVPIVYSEMADVAREYPLVFLKDRALPVALTGIEQGVNAYVAEEGKWLANYIPGRIRAYPFALTEVPEKQGEFAIAFDSEAEQLGTDDGQPLFDANGKPSTTLQARIDLLQQMKQQEARTAQMLKTLRDFGILIERAIRIKRADGEDSQLTGMEVVDEKALNNLPLGTFGELRDQGLLPLIYAHLLSMANLRHGAIAGKYPQMAQPQAKATQGPMTSDELFDEGDDDFTFDFGD